MANVGVEKDVTLRVIIDVLLLAICKYNTCKNIPSQIRLPTKTDHEFRVGKPL